MDAMESRYKKLLNDFDERNEKEKENHEQRILELTNQMHNIEKTSSTEIKRVICFCHRCYILYDQCVRNNICT